MGLGKTYTGAEKLIRLGGKVNLVICQKSKIDDWVEHFREYYQLDGYPYDLTDNKKIKLFIKEIEEMDKFIGFIPLVGVINYDLIFRRPELLKLHYDTILLDESSIIQNRTSKRSKAILNLNSKNCILLSGTPISGKYEKLWSQIKLLGWDISEKLFYNQYVNYHYDMDEGFPRMVIDGYKNVDRLKKKLRDHGAHFLKTDEVIDLPEQVFQWINVPTSKEYKKFTKSRIVTIGDKELVGDTSLTFDLYKRQLCGSYNKDKVSALEDILNSTGDRVIVFYNWNDELYAIEDLCVKLNKPLSIVNGQTKDLTMYEEYSDSVTAIQYMAGAKGLNLQKANKMVYFTPTTMCEDYMQSMKRIHRLGQTKTCFYYFLVCKNSVEEKVYKSLKRGENYVDYLFEE